MLPYNRLTIDLSAIRKNLTVLRDLLPKTGRIMPMMKASAYGTNAPKLIAHLKKWGLSIVGVSHVAEGVFLREQGCNLSIFAIHAAAFEIPYIVENDLEVAVSDFAFCQQLDVQATLMKKKIKVHLHVNTGMHRFGCHHEKALELAIKISRLQNIELEGLMTHFVAAESSCFDDYSQDQITCFTNVYETLKKEGIDPPWVHGSNSAALLRFNLPFCNMARVGLATFGIYTTEEEKKGAALYPALTLKSCVIDLNECPEGSSVGYARTYIVKKGIEKIAILPIGYHDGIGLKYSGKGYCLIQGTQAPYVGRICMDFMMINVSNVEGVTIGDDALIFGKDQKGHELSVEQVAEFAKTNVRELLVSLGPRVERVFLEETTHLHDRLEKKFQQQVLQV